MNCSLLLTLSALIFSQAATQAEDAPRFNVLFLMSDDMRPELACYGNTFVKTPNIDGLAKAGVRFHRAYCQFPLCNPSRTSLLTGRYPLTTGVLDNEKHFRDSLPDIVTLPQLFKQNGYVTLRAGKIFHGGLDDPKAWNEGGEEYRRAALTKAQSAKKAIDRRATSDRIVVLDDPDGQGHGDYATLQKTIEYLKTYKDRPFFMACGFTKPHSPPTAPNRFFGMYDVATVPLPVDFAPRAEAPPGFPKASISRNGDLFIDREATPELAKEMKRAYWASLTWVDWNVGQVIAELDRLGLREKTIIVFWGDHGYHLGEKGKWAKHGSLFETGARVPQIIVAPGQKGNGRSCDRIVETIDLYPTLAALCGLPAPEGLEGDSLVGLLDDPDAQWNKPAFTVTGPGRSVRVDRWRYAEWPEGAMLLDEDPDPNELKNLADDPASAQIRSRLSSMLNTRFPR